MTQGPSRGRPLQLELPDGEGEERAPLQAVEIDKGKASAGKRPQPQPLKRSCVIHFPTGSKLLTLDFFFSVVPPWS